MDITLERVRQILRSALGFDSFTAGFITRVEANPSIPTAGITHDGRLGYNPEFVEKNITCTEDLFCMLFHELLHPMFGHFIYGAGRIENLAADAVINAAISTLYGKASRNGQLFQRYYPPQGLEGLLRNFSAMDHSRYERVYDRLYPDRNCREEQPMTTGELIQTLKILIPPDQVQVSLLLGSHGESQASEQRLPSEVLGNIAEDIRRSLRDKLGTRAGQGDTLTGILLEALKTHLSIRKVLLQQFTTKRKVDHFKESLHAHRMGVSPLPLRPSKRDLVLLSAGLYPMHFHNEVAQPRTVDRGLALYLDVSGSVNDSLPEILGILSGLRREITTVFLFSNQVVEVPFEKLLAGKLQTTWGTDFDCIARSILERGFQKAVIVTDGYATLQADLLAQLKQKHFQALSVLFGDSPNAAALAPLGTIVHLEDICS